MILATLGIGVVVAIVLALGFLPLSSASQEIRVTPNGTTTTSLSITHAGWVTVHFDHPNGMGMAMHYWMQGSNGMMYDHSMMGGADSYSFWSWGGTYVCGAAYSGSASGTTTVWVNATWGML